jgi:hypothetical protein
MITYIHKINDKEYLKLIMQLRTANKAIISALDTVMDASN